MYNLVSWHFPYGMNADGTPKIEREMTPDEYSDYRKKTDEIYSQLKESIKTNTMTSLSCRAPVAINETSLPLIYQNSAKCESITYPCPEDKNRTMATSGSFPIVACSVLRYFGENVTLEALRDVAVFGNWHTTNGTWHHFIDVVLEAHGLQVRRLSDFQNAYHKTAEGGVIIALLKHELFPKSRGNSIVVITGFLNGKIRFYTPSSTRIKEMRIGTFMANTMVLWSVEK